jgi:hypothetical protein
MNSTTTPSGTNSNMNSTTTPSTTNDNYNNAPTTSGTGATNNTDANGTAKTKLPATASPLPLLSLGSLGALASGLWLSRRRQA